MSAAVSPVMVQTAPLELSPPLALLCAAAIGTTAGCPLEREQWQTIIESAEYHGLASFLERSTTLTNAPRVMRERLHAAVKRENALALLLTAELLDLHARFRDANIPMVPFKGPVLAAQLYNEPADRSFSDLDILIAKTDMFRARDLLFANGYAAESPVGSERLEDYSHFAFELNFRRGDHLRVELHWGIAQRQFAVDFELAELFGRTSSQRTGDAMLPCFKPDDHFFLLAVHAARHAWCRLIWILDIAQLLFQSADRMDWPQIMTRSRPCGLERILLVSIGLAHRLFAATVPAELVRAIEGQEVRRVVEGVIGRFEADIARAATEFEPWPMWRHRIALLSRERRNDRLRYIFRLFTEPTEQELALVTLPKPLWFGYSLIRFGHVTAKSFAAAWS